MARAIGIHAALDSNGHCATHIGRDHDGFLRGRDYSPHEHWSDGGPLVEQHYIAIAKGANQICFPGWHAKVGLVNAYDTNTGRQFGPTPLVAAMRALVWSVYGDNLPDEVTP